ncbi:MAG TPA: hypothetical protein PKW33_18780 [Anaerolineaceae bacterium]|nr:hypothetical protein [Anaerolineaceae bacterium]HPN53648.1 hypothetical protein [Anaerolineaceae bacterium]
MFEMRSFDPAALAAFGVLSLLWAAGGYLLAVYALRLRRGERVVGGLALGFVLFLTLANLLSNVIPTAAAYWAAALILAAWGGLLAWLKRAQPLPWREDLRDWPQVAALLALTLVFGLVERGLALFDEYLHLPMISLMATGDIPPHFYLNPGMPFAYHYGLQVWSACLVELANFYPWTAFDLSRALAIAFTLNLGWLWARRAWPKKAAWASLLLTFGGGARWLLLFLPVSVLVWLEGGVGLLNTGADTGSALHIALAGPWIIEGGGAMPFPFAFHNGIFVPVISVLGSTGAMPFMTVLLMLLIPWRLPNLSARLALAGLMASLALSAEHLFALLWGSLFLAAAGGLLAEPRQRKALLADWLPVLGLSALLGVVQGGYITEVVRGVLASLSGAAAAGGNNAYGFSLRWPPALYSAHLGVLSILDIRQLTALLAELGPALLLGVPASLFAWRSFKRGWWFSAGLGLAALFNLLFPLFIAYGVDRSITRMPGTTLWLWLCLALPWLAAVETRGQVIFRGLVRAGEIIILAGGVVIFAIQMTCMANPQNSYFIDSHDTAYSSLYWNNLPKEGMVLDRIAWRSVTVFGRPQKAHSSIYTALPEWDALLNDPISAASQGYDYVYMNKVWWDDIPEKNRARLEAPCVKQLPSPVMTDRHEHRLLDISGCR